jgi:hypothetical protein
VYAATALPAPINHLFMRPEPSMTLVQHILRFAVRVLAVIVIVMLIAGATRKLLGGG